MMHARTFLIVATCALAVAPHSFAQTSVPSSIQHDGVTRSFIVRLPPGFSAEVPHPLVLALHPAASTGARFQETSGWDAVSDARGIVVVYPNGGNSTGTSGNFTWNSWDFTGGTPDDVDFLSTLIVHMQSVYGTDPCRTYMTGFSNGAMMTNSFAAVHTDEVAAIAPVSGGWITAYGGEESDLAPASPVPVWIWRGSNENFVTGIGKNARTRTEQDLEQRDFWVAHNGASLVETASEVLNYGIPRTYVTGIYAGNAAVRFTEVQGTGHLYQPGAADLIWNRFFSQIVSSSGACAVCPTDIDGDGTTDASDLGALLGAWGTTTAAADIDDDGVVSGADLTMLLAGWGPC